MALKSGWASQTTLNCGPISPTQGAAPDTSSAQLPYEVTALRQAIYDSLGGARFTGDGNMGKQSRVSVKVPYPKHAFDATFGKIGLSDMPLSTYVTHEAVDKAIGHGWSSRCHPTSTITFASPREKVHVRYHAPGMIHYSHDNCPRLDSFFSLFMYNYLWSHSAKTSEVNLSAFIS